MRSHVVPVLYERTKFIPGRLDSNYFV